MRRRLLIALFTLGTIGGYGSAIAGMSCHAHARRAAWAHTCAEAAKNPSAAPQDDPR